MPRITREAKHKVHKYKRAFLTANKKNRTPVWRCVLSNCSHYLFTETVIGRVSVCWKCGDNFEIQKVHLERVKPTCSKCRGLVQIPVSSTNITLTERENITSSVQSMLDDLNLDIIMLDSEMKRG